MTINLNHGCLEHYRQRMAQLAPKNYKFLVPGGTVEIPWERAEESLVVSWGCWAHKSPSSAAHEVPPRTAQTLSQRVEWWEMRWAGLEDML